MRIATGEKKFLGQPIGLPKKKVLFISMEEDVKTKVIQRGKKQFMGYSSENKELLKDNLYYSDTDFLKSVNTLKDWNVFEEEIQKYRPRLIIIDSTNRFNSDIQDRTEANILMQKIRVLAQTYKCAILLIHHTTKLQGNRPLTLDNISENATLGRDADLFMGINHLSNGSRYIKFLDNRHSQTPENCIKFSIQNNYLIDFEGLEYEVDFLKSTDNRYDSNNTQKVLEFLKESADSENIIETKILDYHFVEQNGYLSKKPYKIKSIN